MKLRLALLFEFEKVDANLLHSRGHDNSHDDMNMSAMITRSMEFIAMTNFFTHDQRHFIAMIKISYYEQDEFIAMITIFIHDQVSFITMIVNS